MGSLGFPRCIYLDINNKIHSHNTLKCPAQINSAPQ